MSSGICNEKVYGYSHNEIASRLGISISTTEKHVATGLKRCNSYINNKLQINSSSPVSFFRDDEEELNRYEIGLKGTFLDGRLGLNTALFVIEAEGYVETQNMFFFPDGSDSATVLADLEAYGAANNIGELTGLGNTSVRLRGGVNTADINSKGIEFEAAYLLGENWELSGDFTYLDAEFDNGCVPIGEAFGIEDNTLILPGGVGVPCTTVDGNAFPFTTELQLNLAASYSGQINNGIDWFTRLDMRYEYAQYMDWFEAGFLPDSTKFNLRVGISTDKIRMEVYIENLTDDDTPLGAQSEPVHAEVTVATGLVDPSAVGFNVAVAYPRDVGLKVSYSFRALLTN